MNDDVNNLDNAMRAALFYAETLWEAECGFITAYEVDTGNISPVPTPTWRDLPREARIEFSQYAMNLGIYRKVRDIAYRLNDEAAS